MGWLARVTSSLLAIFGSSAQAPAARQPDAFWVWFDRHQDAYFALDPADRTATEKLFSNLAERLHVIDENLTFEFGPEIDGKRELVISAGGIRSSFPVVLALTAAAPQLSRWKITAFRPRRYPVCDLEIGGLKLDARRIFVQLEAAGPKTDLTIYLAGYAERERNKFAQGVYLLLDEALGEYDVETKVGGIDLQALGAAPPPDSVSLAELAQAFDDMVSGKTIH